MRSLHGWTGSATAAPENWKPPPETRNAHDLCIPTQPVSNDPLIPSAVTQAHELADALLPPLMLMGLWIAPTAWLSSRLERQTEILRAEITAQGTRTDQAITELAHALERTTPPVEWDGVVMAAATGTAVAQWMESGAGSRPMPMQRGSHD